MPCVRTRGIFLTMVIQLFGYDAIRNIKVGLPGEKIGGAAHKIMYSGAGRRG